MRSYCILAASNSFRLSRSVAYSNVSGVVGIQGYAASKSFLGWPAGPAVCTRRALPVRRHRPLQLENFSEVLNAAGTGWLLFMRKSPV